MSLNPSVTCSFCGSETWVSRTLFRYNDGELYSERLFRCLDHQCQSFTSVDSKECRLPKELSVSYMPVIDLDTYCGEVSWNHQYLEDDWDLDESIVQQYNNWVAISYANEVQFAIPGKKLSNTDPVYIRETYRNLIALI